MMTKGKFGIPLALIGALAFVFAIFNQPLAILLLAGFALLAEKDEGLTGSTVLALLVNVLYNFILLLFNIFFSAFDAIFDLAGAYDAMQVMGDIHVVVNNIFFVALLGICIFCAVILLCGKTIKLPLFAKAPASAAAEGTEENTEKAD